MPDAEGEEEEETAELQLERMGLTPDWIIQVSYGICHVNQAWGLCGPA